MSMKVSNFQATPYLLTTPVKIAEHFHLSLILLIIGFILTCGFLLY